MKESTYLRVFHNWKLGKDTVLSKYKYSILYSPLMHTWYFIRADKNKENWDWYEPCPEELGLKWDEPVPEELWKKVASYCDNDVIATESAFNIISSTLSIK